MQEFLPPKVAVAVNSSENNTVSSLITLNDNATTLEIHATGTAAVGRWITASLGNPSVISSALSYNADFAVPSNYFRRVAIPIEVMPTPSNMSGGGSLSRNGLYGRLAVKSVGAGSVTTIQYP